MSYRCIEYSNAPYDCLLEAIIGGFVVSPERVGFSGNYGIINKSLGIGGMVLL